MAGSDDTRSASADARSATDAQSASTDARSASADAGSASAGAGSASADATGAGADARSASTGAWSASPSGQRIAKAQDQLFASGTSSRAKYAALVVGRPGLGALLKYELVISLAQARAGALGLVLRKTLYPALLGSCGRNVVFGQNVVLRHPHKIHIGSNVVIDDNCLIDAKGESNRGIRIGDGVFVGRNTILSCKNGDIELAAGANIGFNCEVFSASRVTIGRSVLMAAYCYVVGGDHDFSDPSRPVLEQTRMSAGITIGDGVWMGAGAIILDGVMIGEGAVIGAGAVVRENVAASAIAVGIPARVVSSRRTHEA